MTTHPHEPVTFGQTPLRIEDVLALANRQAPTRLQDDAAYRRRIAKGAQFLDSLLDKEGVATIRALRDSRLDDWAKAVPGKV